MKTLSFFLPITLLILPTLTRADCTCDAAADSQNRSRAIPLKLAALFSILLAGFLGVFIPTLGKWIPAISPEKNIFFAIKSFAAGVILSTGFIHILPDAFDNLTSPCLDFRPWKDFPFAGFFAMVGAIGTLIVDTVASGYYNRIQNREFSQQEINKEGGSHSAEINSFPVVAESGAPVVAESGAGHLHVHTHGHGNAEDLIRRRVISQVLELGIVVHSVIIGISLGVSDNPSSIKPLVVALCFHQFFEGMGLGGCLVQAQFNIRSMITMIIFFCLTTPVGIAIGIGISSGYNENSPTALIIEGILNSGAAGILIYMALVDLLAADFMNPKVQNNGTLQMVTIVNLLVGAGLMSLLAKWA